MQPVATTTIWGRFFFNPGNTGAFSATPSQTPAFTQAFPTINFNPPSGTVPGAPGSIGVYTRPMVDVTTDLNGNYTGSIVAQGSGYAAGSSLDPFDAVFTGEYIVTGTLDVTFNFYSDDGFIFGVGNGATPGMNNPFIGVGAAPYPPTAFANLPMMGPGAGTIRMRSIIRSAAPANLRSP